MKNKPLYILLAVVLVAGSLDRSARQDQRHAVLADICQAFAYNLDMDGRLAQPRIITAGDVGRLFDQFGERSTLGISYKQYFPDFFKRLGDELAQAAGGGTEAAAAPLTPQLREQFVKIFLDASDRIP